MDITLFRCTQCGAVLEIDVAIQKYRCQYCGAHYVKKGKEESRNPQTEGDRVTAFTIAKQLEKPKDGNYFETAAYKKTELLSTSEVRIFEAASFDNSNALNKDERNRHLDTWPRHIRGTSDYERIPSDLKFAYESYIGQGFNPNIYMLYCPPSERAGRVLSSKLLYVYNFSLVCIEREYGKIVLKKFRVEDIEVMEIGSVLLDGWIAITGRIGNKIEKVSVYYNDVKDFLFEKLIEMLRTLALSLADPPKCQMHLTKGKSFGSGLFIEYGITKTFYLTYNSLNLVYR